MPPRTTSAFPMGVLKITIDKVFSLEKAAEALEYLRSGHHRGKVVIKVKE